MSQNSCCVPGCRTSRKNGVPLHRFPNPERAADKFKTWILNIGGELATLDHMSIYDNRRVCNKHFQDIHKYPKNKLCSLAIPVLHLPEQSLVPAITQDPALPSSDMQNVQLDVLMSGGVMHMFPNPVKFPERFKAWVDLVGEKPEIPLDVEYFKKKRICDIHFIPEHRNRNNRLNALAIPILNLPGVSVPQEPENSGGDTQPTTFSLTSSSIIQESKIRCDPHPGSSTVASGGILHRFPNPITDQERFQTWITKIGGEVATLNHDYVCKNKRICHKHFQAVYYASKNRLIKTAVPTLHLPGKSDEVGNSEKCLLSPEPVAEESSLVTLKPTLAGVPQDATCDRPVPHVVDELQPTTSTTSYTNITKRNMRGHIAQTQNSYSEKKHFDHTYFQLELTREARYEMDKACRFCLQSNLNLHLLNNKHHKKFIKDILKTNGSENVSNLVPSEDYRICHICMALLSKAYNFTKMVVNAHKVLHCLLQTNKQTLLSKLTDVDRQEIGVRICDLSTASFEVNIDAEDVEVNDQIQQVVHSDDVENEIRYAVETGPADNQMNNNVEHDDTFGKCLYVQPLEECTVPNKGSIRKQRNNEKEETIRKPTTYKNKKCAKKVKSGPSSKQLNILNMPIILTSQDDLPMFEECINSVNAAHENVQMEEVVETDNIMWRNNESEPNYNTEYSDIIDIHPDGNWLLTEENVDAINTDKKRTRNITEKLIKTKMKKYSKKEFAVSQYHVSQDQPIEQENVI